MWIDEEEKQQLGGEKDVSLLGRLKSILRAPKLIQSRLSEIENKLTKKISKTIADVKSNAMAATGGE